MHAIGSFFRKSIRRFLQNLEKIWTVDN